MCWCVPAADALLFIFLDSILIVAASQTILRTNNSMNRVKRKRHQVVSLAKCSPEILVCQTALIISLPFIFHLNYNHDPIWCQNGMRPIWLDFLLQVLQRLLCPTRMNDLTNLRKYHLILDLIAQQAVLRPPVMFAETLLWRPCSTSTNRKYECFCYR